MHAPGLSDNAPLRADLHARRSRPASRPSPSAPGCSTCAARSTTPRWSARSRRRRAMTPRLTLRYPTVTATADSLLTRAGETVTGHEFHRTHVDPAGGTVPAWTHRRACRSASPARPCTRRTSTRTGPATPSSPSGSPTRCTPSVVEQRAQRVSSRPRREWSRAIVRDHCSTDLRSLTRCATTATSRSATPGCSTSRSTSTPDRGRSGWTQALRDEPRRRRQLPVGRRAPRPPSPHGTGATRDEVLATAGAAEAFTLVARARPWRRPVVVHPQFTEPHAALEQAGHAVTEVVLAAAVRARPRRRPRRRRPRRGRQPDQPDRRPAPGRGPPRAAATGPAGGRRRGVHGRRPRRGRDRRRRARAAGDPQPDQALGDPRGPRRLLLVGPADVVADLRREQAPWSVVDDGRRRDPAPARPTRPRAESERRAEAIAGWRRELDRRPDDLGDPPRPVEHVASCWPRSARAATRPCARAGIAVRRADTFPGLDASWVRIAVRPPEQTQRLLTAAKSWLTPCPPGPRCPRLTAAGTRKPVRLRHSRATVTPPPTRER